MPHRTRPAHRFRPRLTRLEERETPAVAYALSGGSLLAVDALVAGFHTSTIAVSGIGAGESLVGIDVRPADTLLYGLTTTGSAVRLYRINPTTGAATALTATAQQFSNGNTTVPVTGTNFGVDFSPFSDSLRVVTDTGMNFRVDPKTGQLIDGDYNLITAQPGVNPDGNVTGGTVSGGAYTNSSAGANVTTFYTLDASANKLFIQSSPISGNQTGGLTLTINGSTADITAANGFDIPPGVKASGNNTPAIGTGYAALTIGSTSGLYSISLGTGALTLIGSLGSVSVKGFTLAGGGIQVYGQDTGGGTVNVFNADGSTRFVLQPYGSAWAGGVRVAAADVTGDGIQDVITAAGPGGGPHVLVYDGLTGQAVQSFFAYDPGFSLGVYVAAADVNGDGHADIVTGAGAGGGPHVRVFNGTNEAELASFYAYDPNFAGGVSVAAGDLNLDGYADVITAAGPGGGPHVRAFQVFKKVSGVATATFADLASFYAYNSSFTNGVFVAFAARNASTPLILTGTGNGAAPLVEVFDRGGSLLSSFYPYSQQFAGGARVGFVGSSILTAAGPGGGPHAKSFDVFSLAETGSAFVFDASFSGGVLVS